MRKSSLVWSSLPARKPRRDQDGAWGELPEDPDNFGFREKVAFNKQTRQKWPITTAPAPVVPVVVAAASAVAALAELAVANTFP